MAEFDDLEALESCQLDLNHEVEDWLESLQKADQMFYNLMTVEIWSIAQTMDEFNPGFWAQYMHNRQAIVQQQIQERQSIDPRPTAEPLIRKPSPRHPSPFDPTLKRKLLDEAAKDRVSLFSQDLEQALPNVRQSVRPLSAPAAFLEEVSLPVPGYSPSTPTDGTSLELDYDPTGLDLAVAEIHRLESPDLPLPALPDRPSLTDGILVALPHLMRVPLVKVLPLTATSSQECLKVSIACWLTRYFLLPTPDQNGFQLKRQQTMTLTPGQSVICRLGFQLVGLVSSVGVTLAPPLRAQPGLLATWIAEPGPILGIPEAASPEVAVQLINQGSQPCHLQAGQAFCTLDFTCLTDAVPLQQPRHLSQSQ